MICTSCLSCMTVDVLPSSMYILSSLSVPLTHTHSHSLPHSLSFTLSLPILSLSILYRVGWSPDEGELSLGEVPHSFGYGGTGKSSTNSKFETYGEPYGPGDVIGCFLVSMGFI